MISFNVVVRLVRNGSWKPNSPYVQDVLTRHGKGEAVADDERKYIMREYMRDCGPRSLAAVGEALRSDAHWASL